MSEKRAVYLGGHVPFEDEGLKKILMLADKFIDKVEHAKEFAKGGEAQMIEQIVLRRHMHSSK